MPHSSLLDASHLELFEQPEPDSVICERSEDFYFHFPFSKGGLRGIMFVINLPRPSLEKEGRF